MATGRSGVPKGRASVWQASPRAKSMRLAGAGTPVRRRAVAPRVTISLPCWAAPAARFGRAMWSFEDRVSAACRTALRKAIGPARCAVLQRSATSPVRWFGAAMRWHGSATAEIGSADRWDRFRSGLDRSGLAIRIGQDRSHRLLTPMTGAIQRNPLEPRPVLLGASPLTARASLGLGGSPSALTGLRCVVSACLAMAGVPSIGTVPTTLLE